MTDPTDRPQAPKEEPKEEPNQGPDEELDQDLSAWIDGELDPQREAALRARLAAEPRLAARLAELERVDAALRALPTPAVPAGLAAATRARVAGRGRPRPRRRPPVWAAAAVAAGVALAIYGALRVPGSRDEPLADPLAERGFADASDEEIGIVLDYRTLDELAGLEPGEVEMIEDLDLLERLAELHEDEGSLPRGESG